MQFRHRGQLFEIRDPWRDSQRKPWRSLYRWSDAHGWVFVTSASLCEERNYFDGETIEHLKAYVKTNF